METPRFIALLDSPAPSADELREALATFLEGLGEVEQDFQQTFASKPPQIQEYCRGNAERAHVCIQQLRDVAMRAAASASAEAAAALRRGIADVESAFAEFRDATFVPLGPTTLGGVNRICLVVDDILAQREPLSTLGFPVAQEAARFRVGLQSPQNDEETLQAARDVLAALNTLTFLTDPGQLGAARDALVAAAVRWQDRSLHGRTLGPSPMQNVNALILMAEEVLAGKLPPATLREEVQTLAVDFRWLREEMTRFVGGLDGSEVATESERVIELLRRGEEELVGTFELAAAMDAVGFAAAVPGLSDTLYDLTACQRSLRQLAERDNQKVCVHCGHRNSPKLNQCQICQAVLPAPQRPQVATDAAAAPAGELQMTDNLQKLFGAVESYSRRQMDFSDFSAIVSWMSDLLARVKQKTPAVPQDVEDSAITMYLSGLAGMEAGLVLLRQVNSSEQTDLLQQGYDRLYEGALNIQTAQGLARAASAADGET